MNCGRSVHEENWKVGKRKKREGREEKRIVVKTKGRRSEEERGYSRR